MEMVNIKINGMPLSVPNGISILEAARYAGIEIPTLCYLKDINEIGACRICMVEVKGARSLVTACVYPVNEGMAFFPQDHPRTDSLHARPQVPVLCAQRQLRAPAALQGVRRG